MAIAESLLPEYDREMQNTRQVLARVPKDRAGWRPHAKSYTMGDLAMHLTNLPWWGFKALQDTEFHMNPPGGTPDPPRNYVSTNTMLQEFDQNVKETRAALAKASDKDLMVDWTFKYAGQEVFTMPRIVVLRSFMMNHVIHHRGQLTVYLRLNDIPLPKLYGPTADES